ncbi:VLRF1 family aeRF1-type release factor [Alkalibacillus silvisoli]|uniref:VLRF1 family aeRF1-type release factor n=1 Tax=Alkalibacillus silvisoli TaxID=392823 RepID=A0ABP3JVF1_9BACI
MALRKVLQQLENYKSEKPNRVFTMYLNTDLADQDQQGGEWKIHLKNGLNNFEHYLQKDGDSDEKRNFWAVKEKVENYMHEHQKDLKKSVVIFATGEGDIWFSERLQMPVQTAFHWEDQPVLDQLKSLNKQFPKTGIVLTQKEQIKLIDAELGAVNDTTLYELDLNTEDWKQHQGPHHADSNLGSGGVKSSKKDELAERFEENRSRWYKSIAPKIDQYAKNNNWDAIYLVGSSVEVDELERNMNKQVDDKINKNLLDHEEMKIIEEVM